MISATMRYIVQCKGYTLHDILCGKKCKMAILEWNVAEKAVVLKEKIAAPLCVVRLYWEFHLIVGLLGSQEKRHNTERQTTTRALKASLHVVGSCVFLSLRVNVQIDGWNRCFPCAASVSSLTVLRPPSNSLEPGRRHSQIPIWEKCSSLARLGPSYPAFSRYAAFS